MNIKKTILIASLLACTSMASVAQQGDIAQQRRALNAALSTIDEYYVWSTVPNDEAYYEFVDLFVDKGTLIYNDLLGINQGNSLTVEEYAKAMRYKLRNKKVFISNVKTEGLTTENGVTQIRLSLDKSISYIDSCGTYYSNSEFYENHDYRLTVTLNCDSSYRTCKIVSITGTLDSSKKLGNQYFAFQRTSERDNELRYKGAPLHFNSYDQALLEGDRAPNALKKDFSYSNSDMELRPQTKDCQVSMRYKMRRLRLRPYFDLGLGKAFSYSAENVYSESKSSGYSFGLDFGVSAFSKRLLSLGVYAGLGFSQSSMTLRYANGDYNFTSDADVDGDNYVRHYQNLQLKQDYKFSELNIPLYLDFNVRIVKSLSFYLDLGARFDLNLNHKVDATEGSAEVYGIYPQYDNLRLDGSWPYNGFGSRQYGNKDLVSTDLIDVNRFTICGLGGVGLRYNLPSIPLSIEAGVNYVLGFTNLVKTANVVTSDSTTPIVYNTISGAESIEHVRNLTEWQKDIKRQQLRIHIGLILKL